MEEKESVKLPCPISHILVFLGYLILGGIYLVLLTYYLNIKRINTPMKGDALVLVALTEGELQGRSKEDVMGLLNKTHYPPYHKFGFGKYNSGYECFNYGVTWLAFREEKFEAYDVDAESIGNRSAGMFCRNFYEKDN